MNQGSEPSEPSRKGLHPAVIASLALVVFGAARLAAPYVLKTAIQRQLETIERAPAVGTNLAYVKQVLTKTLATEQAPRLKLERVENRQQLRFIDQGQSLSAELVLAETFFGPKGPSAILSVKDLRAAAERRPQIVLSYQRYDFEWTAMVVDEAFFKSLNADNKDWRQGRKVAVLLPRERGRSISNRKSVKEFADALIQCLKDAQHSKK